MDGSTVRAFQDILLALYAEQKSDWSSETQSGRKPSEKAQRLYEQYSSNVWYLIKEQEFEKWLKASDDEVKIDFSERKTILILPPLEKDPEFVPILKIKCALTQNLNVLRLYVLLVRLDEGEGSQGLCGIGFRFEAPENEQHLENTDRDRSRDSVHGFYHAQLINGFDYGPPVKIPECLPLTQPSFPLLADDPVSLVFALIMSLYGKRYCWDFYNKHVSKLTALRPCIRKLQPWIKWEAMNDR